MLSSVRSLFEGQEWVCGNIVSFVKDTVILFYCRKNNIYLARFIPLFREHIGFDLNVEDMMIELVNDCE